MTDEPEVPPPPPSNRPFPPPRPAGKAHPLAIGCMGFGMFFLSLAVFTVVGMASMGQRVWGFLIPLTAAGIMIASFNDRRKRGPAPLLGAAVVGLSIATIVFGICFASMGSFRIQ